ncbi:hypothetical protein FHG66_20635 [Rubellimicrobium rubrum]|uniref:Uncharacterized protein n=1 Tax=Rubellimicrobium rubrum TaxID=2585369 RepID=A0A5C4MJC2_9RHOB|nr:hypothetical protein [Rubellimicrobium rubrum]TNC44605.1 hypothetical protein FHG66_20635 [Rubellimicrobium rubrum]
MADFEDGDVLDLSAFGFTSVGAALQKAEQNGDDLVFTTAGGHSLTLEHTTRTDLTTSDLIL